MHKDRADKRYARANTVLVSLIVLINSYILITPFMPQLQWYWKKRGNTQTKLENLVQQSVAGSNSGSPSIPQGKHLIIPDLLLDEPIYEGTNPNTVNKGIWRRPQTSTPDKGGNTVLVGHRFTYHGASVFYHLDQLEVGRRLSVFWNGIKYVYEVKTVTVVPPTAVSVEAPTKDDRLTLYTCTPLWSAKNRLVIVAEKVDFHE